MAMGLVRWCLVLTLKMFVTNRTLGHSSTVQPALLLPSPAGHSPDQHPRPVTDAPMQNAITVACDPLSFTYGASLNVTFIPMRLAHSYATGRAFYFLIIHS